MPINTPLVISSVNTGTDELTITAHGLVTGDGFLAAYSPDGGALPSPLAPVTDYWAIKTGTDTIKLATSSSNAMAGTAINLTTTGSGTLQLLRGLPYRRPRISVPGSQIHSADNNATWESLQALWNLLTGQAQTIWGGIKLAANQHVQVSGTGKYKRGSFRRPMLPTFTASNGTWTWSIGPLYHVQAGSSATALITLPCEVGDRITDLEINVFGNGTADCAFNVAVLGSGQAKTDLFSGSDLNRSAAWATLALSSLGTFTPHTMVAGESLVLIVAPNASGYTLGNTAGVFDVP